MVVWADGRTPINKNCSRTAIVAKKDSDGIGQHSRRTRKKTTYTIVVMSNLNTQTYTLIRIQQQENQG